MAESNSLSILTLSLGIIPTNGTVFDTVFPNRVVSIQRLEMNVLSSNSLSCSVASTKFPHCISSYNSDSGNTVNDTKFMVNGCSWLNTLAVLTAFCSPLFLPARPVRYTRLYLIFASYSFLHCSIISLAVYPLFIIANVLSSPDSVPILILSKPK